MEWPLKSPSCSLDDVPFMNGLYLFGCHTSGDSMITWGTEVCTESLEQWIQDQNQIEDQVPVTIAHALIKATGIALERHPEFNRRVIGRRIYEFQRQNVLMGMQHPRERRAELVLLRDVAQKSLPEIAQESWDLQLSALRGNFPYDAQDRALKRVPQWLRPHVIRFNLFWMHRLNLPATQWTERQRCSPVLINYLGFANSPPLRSYHASRLPVDSTSLNVTMGAPESRPVVNENGELGVGRRANLFVKADHRLVDAVQLGKFMRTLCDLLGEPEVLASSACELNEESTPNALDNTRLAS